MKKYRTIFIHKMIYLLLIFLGASNSIEVLGAVIYNVYFPKASERIGYAFVDFYLNDDLYVTSGSGSCVFYIQLEENYNKSIPKIELEGTYSSLDTAQLEGGKWKYNLEGIRSDIKVKITGININSYTISLPSSQNGYSLVKPDGNAFDASDLQILYDGDFQFKLNLDPAYDQSNPVVKVEGDSNPLIPGTDGVYTISQVQSDKTIEVTGVKKNGYTITLPSEQNGYSLVKPDGTAFESLSLPILLGEDFEFKLKLEAGCDRNDPEVCLDGSVLQPNSNGVYVINDIREDKVLTFYFTPVPVYYSVCLPAVEGAVTDPVAGEYEVEAQSSFRFYLTLKEDYNLSQPVVTTDLGETISPRISDGAYIIKYVSQPVNIYIDGIVQNPPPVANVKIKENGVDVKTENGILFVSTPRAMKVCIYSFSGSISKDLGKVNGNVRVTLPKGSYIVVVDSYSKKVVL